MKCKVDDGELIKQEMETMSFYYCDKCGATYRTDEIDLANLKENLK